MTQKRDQKITIHSAQDSVIVGGDVQGDVNLHAKHGADDAGDIKALIEDLAKLRAEMKKRAQSDDEDIAIGHIAQAEKAAKSSDTKTVLKHLKDAGEWALDIAKEVGTSVATEFLKKSMGVM